MPDPDTTLIHARLFQDDYALWSQMSHITVQWIELTMHRTRLDRGLMLLSVIDALVRYHEFNSCYDSNDTGPVQVRAAAGSARGVTLLAVSLSQPPSQTRAKSPPPVVTAGRLCMHPGTLQQNHI